MTCPSDHEIERSLDGAPVERGAPPIEAHLDDCPRCRERAAKIESLDAALAAGLLARAAPVARQAEDPRRIAPRLRSRFVAIGDEEYARRAEALASTQSGRLRATTRLADARRRRSAGRSGPLQVQRRRGAPVAALAAAVALATAGGVFIALAISGKSGEEPAKGSLVKLPELKIEAQSTVATTAAGPASKATFAGFDPAPERYVARGVHLPREGFDGDGEPVAPATPPATTLADLPPAAPEAAPAPEPQVARAAPASPGPAPSAEDNASLAAAMGSTTDTAPIALELVRGDLRVRKAHGQPFTRVAGARAEIVSGDTLRAEKPGAALVFGRGAELFIRAGTEVSISRRSDGSGYSVWMEGGEVVAEVAPGIANNHLALRSTLGAAEVEGARVGVQIVRGLSKFFVLEGAAKVWNNAGEIAAARGDAASAVPSAAPTAKRFTEAEVAAFAFADRLRPRRTALFQASFDRGAGPFDGLVVKAGAGAPGAYALELKPVKNDPRFGERTAARRSGLFRARPGAEIRFSYFLPEPSPVVLQAQNETQRELYRAALEAPVVGRWTTVSIFVDELAFAGEGARRSVQDGDVFSSIELLAGKPNAPVKLLVDHVIVFERE